MVRVVVGVCDTGVGRTANQMSAINGEEKVPYAAAGAPAGTNLDSDSVDHLAGTGLGMIVVMVVPMVMLRTVTVIVIVGMVGGLAHGRIISIPKSRVWDC